MGSTVNDTRKIRDVRDIWMGANGAGAKDPANAIARTETAVLDPIAMDLRTRHKYKTLERHLSMKKTIRKKIMRDLSEIGDAAAAGDCTAPHNGACTAFLDQLKNDQPPPANIDKPSLWKRLTKGWGGHS